MSYKKTGELIAVLRKEKGMTQKQLAQLLHVSDRTVSKWERGLGYPDVSLLASLSGVLGVNIEGLLAGSLDEKDGGGNMKKLTFYVCESCGNVMVSTGGAEVTCCGRKLTAIPAGKAKAVAGDVNTPQVKIEEVENEYFISIEHEMSKENYVSFVACAGYDRVMLVKLYPEQNAEFRLPHIPHGKLYVYSAKQGLYGPYKLINSR